MITIEKFEHLKKILEKADVNFAPMDFIHGLVTAAAIGPVMVPPSKWLPMVFYEREKMPEFKSLDQTQLIISTLLNIYNENLADIRDNNFGPLLAGAIDENGQEITNAEMWCNGFILGSTKWGLDWDDVDDKEVIASMTLILELSSESTLFKRKARKKNKAAITELEKELNNTLADAVYAIHDYWFEDSNSEMISGKSSADNYPILKPKIGRNDPCPCGSGKKFKNCCGAK